MAISWGGAAGHLQVGIDVRTSGYDANTPCIDIYIDYYVQSVAWGFNDPQTLTSYVNGGARDTFSYTMVSGTGQTVAKYVGTTTVSCQGQSCGGGPAYTFQGNVAGNSQGANPSHAIGWSLPPRAGRAPTAPGVSVGTVTQNSATIIVTAADGGCGGVTSYETNIVRVSDGAVVASWGGGSGTVSNLTGSTTYYARAVANNPYGSGPWAYTGQFTTLSGGAVKVAGTWRSASSRTKVAGSWRDAKVWKKAAGTWRS